MAFFIYNSLAKLEMVSRNQDRFFEVKRHEHIVLCVDRFNPLGIIRALGEAGVKPVVILITDGGGISACRKSRYIKELHLVDSSQEAMHILLSRYQLSPSPFLYVCDDRRSSLLDLYYDQLINRFYFFHGRAKGDITELMDKSVQYSLAERCGFNVPSFQVFDLDLNNEIRRINDFEFTYPVITKDLSSIIGGWKADVFQCNSQGDLQLALNRINSPKVIIQKYITKIDEVSLDGFSIDGGRFVYIPFEVSFYRTTPTSYGYYIRVKPFENKDLMDKITSLIRHFNYTGCFDVELLIDREGVYHFLEVNLRFSCWNWAVTSCSFNYPLEWAKATLDYEKNQNVTIDNSVLQIGTKSGMVEPMDFHESVLSHKVPLIQWLKQLISADFLFIFNKKDIRPAISYWKETIKRFVKKKHS